MVETLKKKAILMNLTDATEIYSTPSIDSELPIVIFQQLASKLVEMLSDVRVIKEVAADLVPSYDTQIETAAYRMKWTPPFRPNSPQFKL